MTELEDKFAGVIAMSIIQPNVQKLVVENEDEAKKLFRISGEDHTRLVKAIQEYKKKNPSIETIISELDADRWKL